MLFENRFYAVFRKSVKWYFWRGHQ